MTSGAFAALVGADPKWVQNAVAALGSRLASTLPHGQRLTVARALADSTGMSLTRAWDLATEFLDRFTGEREPVTIVLSDPAVSLTIDLYRLLVQFSIRLSWLRTEYQPRRRGRPPKRRKPIDVATEYGLDPGLIQYNLSRTPAERLRQLDAMAEFQRRVRRV